MIENIIGGESNNNKRLVAFYNRKDGTFKYHKDILAYFGKELQNKTLWDHLAENDITSHAVADRIKAICLEMDEENSIFEENYKFTSNGLHTASFVCFGDTVSISFKKITRTHVDADNNASDELTGLLRRKAFCSKVEETVRSQLDRKFALFLFDIVKFKAINEIYGFAEGDKLLMYIADKLRYSSMPILYASRESGDVFAFLADVTSITPDSIINKIMLDIDSYNLQIEINCNVGIYEIIDHNDSGNSMLDKAMLAQSSIKGNYAQKVNYYTDKLRLEMLSEQEITGMMNIALEERQFVVYYQPQYNHSTGMIIGAEALIRWVHPEKNLISPGVFIPIFERNGFITKVDFYVFERVCEFLRKSIDNNYAIVPISINFSKHDIYSANFVDMLEAIRIKHDIPAKYLRIEITESVLFSNTKAINDILKQLHRCGYIVEMDDFGAGYSSLNVLKDLEFDIIKLDMLFLRDESSNGRGGTILSSVVNMAKWLNMPVIAEGVETVEQADFLRSIGCDYIQGYLYSRPLPEADYEKLISAAQIGTMVPQSDLIEMMNSNNFWDPKSQETLIFNNFVGGAVIFQYDTSNNSLEIKRVNKKYLQELGMNLSEHDIIHGPTDNFIDGNEKEKYLAMLHRAIDTLDEQECETWRLLKSSCCGEETVCIRSTVKLLGSIGDKYLFYAMIRNVTAEKQLFNDMSEAERRFKYASEQVNIYFWEYTIATREMRPCFRCMRDLGLPPLLRNYPDSAIERGIFPPEVADMYRDWHVQVANGVKELEAVIPLTPNRVPFHVRYTTEFDENGHPIKAYGSAALVVDQV